MAQQIQLRRGTASQWTSANPVLAQGEPGVETDTGKLKVGDGSTAWASLAYVSGSGGGGATVGALLASNNLSDVANTTTARTNLGLGSAATQATTAFDAAGAATAAQTAAQASSLQKTSNLSDVASPASARTSLGLGSAATMSPADLAADPAFVGGYRLKPTATKTSAYVAAVGDLVPVNATGGAVVITLPAGAAAGDAVGVRRADATANTVTVSRASADLIANGTSTATTTTLALQDSVQVFVSNGAGTWTVAGGHRSLAQLDNRYASAASAAGYTWTATKTADYTAVAGDAIPVNATSASVTVTLPASPAQGVRVLVQRVDPSPYLTNATLTVTGAGITQILAIGMVAEFLYDGTAWRVRQDLNPATLLTPPMQNADDPGGLIQSRGGNVVHHHRQPLFTMNTLTDYDAFTKTTGTISAALDSSPFHPNGCPAFTTTSVSGNLPTSVVVKRLLGPVDMTNMILRVMQKLQNPNASPRSALLTVEIRLSSDRFNTGNYHTLPLMTSNIPENVWLAVGGAVANATAVGTGADLTAINAIGFALNCQSSSTWTWSLQSAEIVPVTAAKAKCVLWFDDSYVNHFTTMQPYLDKYGWRATLGAMVGQSDGLTPDQLRRIQHYGWQVATHAFSFPEHSTMAGVQLRQALQKTRHAMATIGTWGAEDFAIWGGLPITEDTLRAFRQSFRTVRNAPLGPNVVETLPPVDPYYMTAWQYASDTVGAMSAYVDKAIASKGLAQFLVHNTSTIPASFIQLLDYLDSKRSQIDVVLMSTAIAPYLDTAPVPTSPYTVPGQVSAVTTQNLPTSVALSWPRPTSGGAPIRRYAISRSTSSGAEVDVATIDATAGSDPVYVDTGLTAGTTYYYKVRARNAVGDGAASTEVSATPVSAVTRPTTPATSPQPAGWWKISDVGGAANGAAITSVTDSSGNSKTMSTSGSPTMLTSALNGLPAMRHVAASSQYAKAAVSFQSENCTVIIVGRPTGTGTTSQSWVNDAGSTFTNTNNFDLRREGTTGGQMQAGAARTSKVSSAPYVLPVSTWAVVSASIGAGTAHVTKVSTNGMVQTSTPTAWTAAAALGNVAIGGPSQSQGFADLDWTEAVVFTSELSDADRKAWEVYLGTANGLPVYGY